jgi:hypothetical protein
LGREVLELRGSLEAKEGEVSLLTLRLDEAAREVEVLRREVEICNAEKAQGKKQLTRPQRERCEMDRKEGRGSRDSAKP